MSKQKSKPVRIGKRRGWAAFLFFVLVGVGLAVHTGMGTYSSFGIDQIAAICPVGALETLVTGQAPTGHLLVGLAIAVVAVLIFGKAFCAWLCPTPWIQKALRKKKAKAVDVSIASACNAATCSSCKGACALEPKGGKRDGLQVDSRHAILGGALISTAVFGFPVFCLVCPVGLSIATFIAVWHLFQFNEATWGLVVFPIIVIAEVVLLRGWCRSFCPIGALMSLLSAGNKTFRPRVDTDKCLRGKGVDCGECVGVCPESLDPHSLKIPECTKCGKCVEHCPEQAITMPLLPRSKRR
jgi:ferredoxin-type protein NapH